MKGSRSIRLKDAELEMPKSTANRVSTAVFSFHSNEDYFLLTFTLWFRAEPPGDKQSAADRCANLQPCD